MYLCTVARGHRRESISTHTSTEEWVWKVCEKRKSQRNKPIAGNRSRKIKTSGTKGPRNYPRLKVRRAKVPHLRLGPAKRDDLPIPLPFRYNRMHTQRELYESGFRGSACVTDFQYKNGPELEFNIRLLRSRIHFGGLQRGNFYIRLCRNNRNRKYNEYYRFGDVIIVSGLYMVELDSKSILGINYLWFFFCCMNIYNSHVHMKNTYFKLKNNLKGFRKNLLSLLSFFVLYVPETFWTSFLY